MTTLAEFLNNKLAGKSSAEVVALTCCAVLAVQAAHKLLEPGFLHKRSLAAVFRVGRKLLAPIISKEIAKKSSTVKYPQKPDEVIYDVLPATGMSRDDVIALCQSLDNSLDFSYHEGGVSGTVYHGGKDFTEMINRVMEVFQWSNPLHLDIFGAIRKMEAEVVSMVLDMYNGHTRKDACGAVTSGGTESIGMAVKVYRDWGRHKLGISNPSIVMPNTAHVAFDKACAYYGVELIKVPVGSSGAVDPKLLETYIRADTVAIVGSSPTFPHGTVDPIPELSEIAFKRGIGMHVDACLGGFVVPFMSEAGVANAPIVDFRNRGVMTISADTHKYGCAPKGTSCILYASKELRQFQFFTVATWPGGIYCSPGASGSRAGNVIAGTWAAMLHFGRQGYVANARALIETRAKITNAISKNPHLRVLGNPTVSVFAFTSDDFDIFVIGDELKKRKWMLSPLQYPSGLQFSLTILQTQSGVAEHFIADVTAITDAMRADMEEKLSRGEKFKKGDTGATLYGVQQRIPDRSIIESVMAEYLNGYYETHHGSVVKEGAKAEAKA